MSRKRSRFEAIPSGSHFDTTHDRYRRRMVRVLTTAARGDEVVQEVQEPLLSFAPGMMNVARSFGLFSDYGRAFFGLHTGRVHFIQRQWRRAITRRRMAVLETLKLPFELVERIWRQVVSAVSVPLRGRVVERPY